MDIQIHSESPALVMRSYERALGLSICLRCMDTAWQRRMGLLALPGRMRLHYSPFCWPQKQRRQSTLCKRSCHWECGAEAAAQDLPFIRTCHAGADEIVVPVHDAGHLVLMAQLGQFRRSSLQPSSLPLWSLPRCRSALALCHGLQTWLQDLLERMRAVAEADVTGVRGRIERFLQRHLGTDPDLTDLAEHLRCSPAWAAEQVRRHCATSWRALKNERRLDMACRLLADSELKIAAVADRLGMADADYFCRWFKRMTASTPGTWRRVNRREPPAV